MKKAYVIYWLIIALSVVVGHQCQAQVIYSSWSSAQVKHAVETEKPVISSDTVFIWNDFDGVYIKALRTQYRFKGFLIDRIYHGKTRLTVYSGNFVVALKPDDEYEVIEKLLNLK
jgi:hypothetical protein